MAHIASETTIQAYQLRKGGTRARMAILRMIAAASVDNFNEATRLQPGDWKGARHYGLDSYAAAYGLLSRGQQSNGETVWYEHHGQSFRNVRPTHEVVSTRHRGWFTDTDGQETAFGIVASLPHGRFLAGYEWTSNGERVYFSQVFTDEEEAAHMADEHARVFAEASQEDARRFDAMQDAENEAEEAVNTVRSEWANYKAARVAYLTDPERFRHSWELARIRVDDAISELRDKRDELKQRTDEYERASP